MSPAGRPPAMAETINATLADLMEQDPRVVLLGEDVGRLGGVFRVTRGLQQRFGPTRVRDSLLAESTIIGQSVGLALSGLVPICEIQFDGFANLAVNQLVSQAARIRQRWNGQATAGMVIRVATGGGFRGVEHHSESNEALFARAPGLSVACPSNGRDAEQILRHAVTAGEPVVIYEPIRLYWRRGLDHDGGQATTATSARVLRRGSDVTVVTYGAVVHDVLAAAQALGDRVDVEVVDLRWIAPLDLDTVLASVARTGRLLIVHEASRTVGVGAEVAAAAADVGFGALRGPIRRVAPERRPYPPADLEHEYLIDVAQIESEILAMTT